MDTNGLELLSAIAESVDVEALFAALPEDEFAKLIDDRMERISEAEREIVAAQERIAKYTREAESFRGALRIKRELKDRRKAAETQAANVATAAISEVPKPRELMKRKRAAVSRVLETDPDREVSPEQVDAAIRQRQLLTDTESRAGTPIRIVMAKMAKEGLIFKPRQGRYRLAAEAAPENGASPRVQSEGPTSPQQVLGEGG